jgi:hypothetical protein
MCLVDTDQHSIIKVKSQKASSKILSSSVKIRAGLMGESAGHLPGALKHWNKLEI